MPLKKLIALLLFFSGPSFAAQVISTACINEVGTKLEYRFTHNPNDGRIYAWARYLQPMWFGSWRYCWLYYIQPDPMTQTGAFPISTVMNGTGIRSVINPNGGWFVTNAVGIEQDQAGLDWCTQ